MKAKKKILVVDDDSNIRKTLAEILSVKGYETAVADSGAEAIAAMESGDISLALIDLGLPDMQGLEVMARLKAMSPMTEVIILTGNASSMDTAIEATSQGAFSYLVKPYKMGDLLLNIKHGVERQQEKEEILRLASFPGLAAMGQSHPLLHGALEMIADLRQDKIQGRTTTESTIGETTFELHLSHVLDVHHIRIYVVDITRRKRGEDALREKVFYLKRSALVISAAFSTT